MALLGRPSSGLAASIVGSAVAAGGVEPVWLPVHAMALVRSRRPRVSASPHTSASALGAGRLRQGRLAAGAPPVAGVGGAAHSAATAGGDQVLERGVAAHKDDRLR